ncbi:MAG: Adaptive-response sensory-kinase SasA [Phycisphaerae bacterium]|nr:Adaptive-response sensory-kinase SasA [Phycisphaerae bacterium]
MVVAEGMNPPIAHHRPRQDAHRQHVLLSRILYVITGAVLIIGTGLLMNFRQQYSQQSKWINQTLAGIIDIQSAAGDFNALLAQFHAEVNPNPSAALQLQHALDRMEDGVVAVFKKPPDTAESFFELPPLQNKFKILQEAWSSLQSQVQGLNYSYLPRELINVQETHDRFLVQLSGVSRGLIETQVGNESARSWIAGIMYIWMLASALLLLWSIWSSSNSRLETLALNIQLERRVDDRTRELERANLFLGNVQSSLASALVVSDAAGQIVTWNSAAERLWNYPRPAALGQNIFHWELFSQTPDLIQALQQAQQTQQLVSIPEITLEVQRENRRFCRLSIAPLVGPRQHLHGLVVLVDDVTELVTARQELASRTDEAQHANQILQRVNGELENFVYAASHDLRSPLVNLEGLTRKLDKSWQQVHEGFHHGAADVDYETLQPLLDHDIPKALQRIHTSIAKFGGIIDGLLRLSRNNRQELNWIELDMNQLVARMVEMHSATLEANGVGLFVGELPNAWGDHAVVDQVWSNLFENALNYLDSNRAGEIVLEGERGERFNTYYVRDNGIGIAPEHIHKIFRIFERLQPQHCAGEGLGLAIVKRIVERHGGEMGVESSPEQGTCFWFTLPAREEFVIHHKSIWPRDAQAVAGDNS